MRNDRTTLKDLSIFTAGSSGGVFDLLDRVTTSAGREALRTFILHPPATYESLIRTQDAVRWWTENGDKWTDKISNGTLVMLEKFFESADSVSAPPTGVAAVLGPMLQKWLNRGQFTFVQFSLTHLTDVVAGAEALTALLKDGSLPPMLREALEEMKRVLSHPLIPELRAVTKATPFAQLSRLAFRARRELKLTTQQLIAAYARLDALQALARATREHRWTFPELLTEAPVRLEAAGLHHPLLQKPVGYEVAFRKGQNFMLLTGANMSGKTTFMRALGVGALLAHLGCGVPATSMRISFLHGVVTNMHVEDNLLRGESYFFAEVQRMKGTAQRLVEDKPHLVLMDELFKGTNVHDAYECTRAVVEGLLKHPRHLMVLSTHLHEVAEHFSERSDILFAYFVTDTAPDGAFQFSYTMRPGISSDRIGYRILQQEGVIDLLLGSGG